MARWRATAEGRVWKGSTCMSWVCQQPSTFVCTVTCATVQWPGLLGPLSCGIFVETVIAGHWLKYGLLCWKVTRQKRHGVMPFITPGAQSSPPQILSASLCLTPSPAVRSMTLSGWGGCLIIREFLYGHLQDRKAGKTVFLVSLTNLGKRKSGFHGLLWKGMRNKWREGRKKSYRETLCFLKPDSEV